MTRRDEIELIVWPLKLVARGERAVSAVKWPFAILVCAFAITFVMTIGFS